MPVHELHTWIQIRKLCDLVRLFHKSHKLTSSFVSDILFPATLTRCWSHTTPSLCNCSVLFSKYPCTTLFTDGSNPSPGNHSLPASQKSGLIILKAAATFLLVVWKFGFIPKIPVWSQFSPSVCSYCSYIVFWYFWSTFRSLDLKASSVRICNVAEKAPKPQDRFPLVMVSLGHCKTNLSVSETGFSCSPFPGMCCVLHMFVR